MTKTIKDSGLLAGRSGGMSRRTVLKTGAGAAALLASIRMNFPGGAFAQGAGPEVKGT